MHLGKITNTESERLALYKQSQKIIEQEVPIIPLAYPTNHIVYNKRVKNFDIRPDGILFFDDIYIENP